MTLLIALVLFLVFLLLSMLHVYWGLGGRWGMEAAVPTINNQTKVMNPGTLACFVVAFGLLGFGLLALVKAGLLPIALPKLLYSYGLYAVGGLFILRAIGDFNYVGFFKKHKDTLFGIMDTKYYSPLCVFIGLLMVLLELWTH